MLTAAASASLRDPAEYGADTVVRVRTLLASGWTASRIRAQLNANRWQRVGTAIIRHNGDPSTTQLRQVALAVQAPARC